jgi:hypothetical protein
VKRKGVVVRRGLKEAWNKAMNLNHSNRPVRTRMPGGMGRVGARGLPYPDLSHNFSISY